MTVRPSMLVLKFIPAYHKTWNCNTMLRIGGFVVGDKTETALLYCKSSAVLAGVPFADVIFEQLDLQCTWNFDEGSYIDVVRDGGRNKRVVAAKVTGDSLIYHLVLATIFKLYFLTNY